MDLEIDGNKEQWEILRIIPFTSARKRMTVVARKVRYSRPLSYSFLLLLSTENIRLNYLCFSLSIYIYLHTYVHRQIQTEIYW